MNSLLAQSGIDLVIKLGEKQPSIVTTKLLQAVEKVEVTHTDAGRSGFQITFKAKRKSMSTTDYDVQQQKQLKALNRVQLLVRLKVGYVVLMDGIITHLQCVPSENGVSARIIATGEDVSIAMDLEEKLVGHPEIKESKIVEKIIKEYGHYNIEPEVKHPLESTLPEPTEPTVQRGTDLAYLQAMALRYGYVFYVKSQINLTGKVSNKAYWGPTKRDGKRQSTLSAGIGAYSNVSSIEFEHNTLLPTLIKGHIQDSETDEINPVETEGVGRDMRKPLAKESTLEFAKKRQLIRTKLPEITGGLVFPQAQAHAVGNTNASTDNTVTAKGELNTKRYGHLLQTRQIVGLRGVGDTYNGLYYVKRVKHVIQRGSYQQSFTLTREGIGSSVRFLGALS